MKFAEWAKSSLSQQTIISFAVNLLVVTSQKKLSSGCHKPLTENRTVCKGNRIFHWVPDRTADSGSAILGERAATPCSPARRSGERCEIRHRVRGGASTAQWFPLFSALRMAAPDSIILLIVDYHAAIGRHDPRESLCIGLHPENELSQRRHCHKMNF